MMTVIAAFRSTVFSWIIARIKNKDVRWHRHSSAKTRAGREVIYKEMDEVSVGRRIRLSNADRQVYLELIRYTWLLREPENVKVPESERLEERHPFQQFWVINGVLLSSLRDHDIRVSEYIWR